MRRITISDELQEFLTGRVKATAADVEIAAKFLEAFVPDEDDTQDFFAIREHEGRGRISYSTRARLHRAGIRYVEDGIFKHGGHRTHARPGAVAQRVTGIEGGHALDVFSTAVGAYVAPEVTVQVVSGDRITHWYKMANHCTCVGRRSSWGGGPATSCMSQPHYTEGGHMALFEAVAEMAIVVCQTCGKLRARAIVWTAADGTKVYDRPYGNSTEVEQMRAHLVNLGMTTAGTYDYGSYSGSYSGGKPVPLPEGLLEGMDKLPALDTMRSYCKTCNVLLPYGQTCPEGHPVADAYRVANHGRGASPYGF